MEPRETQEWQELPEDPVLEALPEMLDSTEPREKPEPLVLPDVMELKARLDVLLPDDLVTTEAPETPEPPEWQA
jgi:hypothetical protein